MSTDNDCEATNAMPASVNCGMEELRAPNLTEEKTCTLSCLAIVRYDTKAFSYVMSTLNAYLRMMRIPLAEYITNLELQGPSPSSNSLYEVIDFPCHLVRYGRISFNLMFGDKYGTIAIHNYKEIKDLTKEYTKHTSNTHSS